MGLYLFVLGIPQTIQPAGDLTLISRTEMPHAPSVEPLAPARSLPGLAVLTDLPTSGVGGSMRRKNSTYHRFSSVPKLIPVAPSTVPLLQPERLLQDGL